MPGRVVRFAFRDSCLVPLPVAEAPETKESQDQDHHKRHSSPDDAQLFADFPLTPGGTCQFLLAVPVVPAGTNRRGQYVVG